MRYMILMLVALLALSGCASQQHGTGKMDEKRYERQINDAEKSIHNIDN